MTAIIDYGAGNLTSVRNACAALGAETVVTRDASIIERAERVIFPGVGAAKSAMDNLASLNLTDVVRAAADSGRPFLGICLGMQILFARSEEDGGVETLGLFNGNVKRFPDFPGFKVPEIGWNSVRGCETNSGVAGSAADKEFYFVHSYYAEVVPETVGVTEYAGIDFTAMVKRGKLWACQFHPEKSGRIGLELMADWFRQ